MVSDEILTQTIANGEAFFAAEKYNQAFDCFMYAANQGSAKAMIWAAQCFLGGLGVQKDANQAYSLYLKAAECGDSEAQFLMALWYSDGIHCIPDLQKSIFWCSRAAKQGHNEAAEYMLVLAGDDV